ncbi:Na+/H+ antiporter subunit G [Ideonella sp. A 288]|uniref:Na+/H+ antiporter subunit G n=1 Tax=Ideonella sp. A 288 TaxID=1962181 RepID=UPI000B4ABCA2|nr:Na+/H+ antiporter subunit G [Ideonella sp. A 288]
MTQELPLWADALASVLLVVGAAFALVGAIGLARLSDFFKRLHGPSKATTLGVGCVLLASALVAALTGKPSLHEGLITVFLFLTAPVSAHLLVQLALKLTPGLRPARPDEQRTRADPPPG